MNETIQRPRQRTTTFTFCVLFLALAIGSACGTSEQPNNTESAAAAQASSGDVKRFQLRGKVVQLEPNDRVAAIQHQEIVGWMDAMTMRFPIKEQADWDKLAVGEEIEGTVFVNDDGFYVGEIKVVDGAEQAPPAP